MILLSKPAVAAPSFKLGLDFRSTAVYVTTDPANCYFIGAAAGMNDYPTAIGGANVGWVARPVTAVNGNTTLDNRLAGFSITTSGSATFRIDLPQAGNYVVNLGLGDARTGGFGPHANYLTVFNSDNSTPLLTRTTPTQINYFTDATGAAYGDGNNDLVTAGATWAAANPLGGGGSGGVPITITSSAGVTAAFIQMLPGPGGTYGTTCALMHFMISSA